MGLAQDQDEDLLANDEDSDPNDLESYYGSELDPLDIPELEDLDVAHIQQALEAVLRAEAYEDDEQSVLGHRGLLTDSIVGGSLHSSEPEAPLRQTAFSSFKVKSSCVAMPSLLWRGKNILVVNKPAGWICSASDVEKRMGKPLDPNMKLSAMKFKVLDDLQQHKFGDREKKIHPLVVSAHARTQAGLVSEPVQRRRELWAVSPIGPGNQWYHSGWPELSFLAGDAGVLSQALCTEALHLLGAREGDHTNNRQAS